MEDKVDGRDFKKIFFQKIHKRSDINTCVILQDTNVSKPY